MKTIAKPCKNANVRDAAFADLSGMLAFTTHMLDEGRIYASTSSAACRTKY